MSRCWPVASGIRTKGWWRLWWPVPLRVLEMTAWAYKPAQACQAGRLQSVCLHSALAHPALRAAWCVAQPATARQVSVCQPCSGEAN